MGEIKVEFAVQMGGQKCAEKVREALKDCGQLDIDLEMGRVIIQTDDVPWSVLQDKIEKTGRRAVLSGFGGRSAVAMINTGEPTVKGVVRFTAIDSHSSGCVVDGTVDGLPPGLHGIHVHESGDISLGCQSVGEHYNPRGSPHGDPNDPADQRHAGDLGNIRADQNGRATFRFIDSVLDVNDIIGRSVVITNGRDDYGRGESAQSKIDGNSGERLSCGIIARAAGIYQNYKKMCACDGITIWDERDKPLAGAHRSKLNNKQANENL